jgi:hypothetical protein
MAERTSVTQVVQIGVETTEGTGVAANRQMPSWQIATKLDGSATEVASNGYKFATQEVIGKDFTTAKLSESQPTYDEMAYIHASLLQYTAPVQIGATTAYTWTSAPSSSAEDTRKFYTVEQGSAFRAQKFAGAFFDSMTLKGDRDKVTVAGSMIGRLFTDGITLTGSPTVIAQQPMLPKEVSIYRDTTSGGLGGTKLLRVLSWELALQNTKKPLWAVDAAQTSYAASVEAMIGGTLKLKMEADAAGMAALTDWRAGNTTAFIRLAFLSASLAGVGNPFSCNYDLACQVKEPPAEISDQDGVYAIEWTYAIVHNAGWAKAMTIALVNQRTTA